MPNLNLDEKKEYLRKLERLIKGGSWPDKWSSQRLKVWREIAKEECIEYLIYSADKRNLSLDQIGEKTHSIFEAVLEEYSIAQIFNLTFQAAMSTSDYAIRENIPRYRAKNMLIGNIQRKADKARAEGWEVKNSRRDFNCPQSVLSSTFFDTVLGIGAQSLETRMPIESEEETSSQ